MKEVHLVLVNPTLEDIAYTQYILSKFTHQEYIIKKLSHLNPVFVTRGEDDKNVL